MKSLAILALSLATAISGIPPAGAFPIIPAVKSQTTDVERVQFPYERGEHRKQRARQRCSYYSCPRYRDGYRYSRYRYHRRYHRHRDNDAGAIIGGLAAGMIIGGLLSQRPRYYSGGNAHARWCYARYRSYRAYDNTFKPYYGPRRQCLSPYL